MGKEALYRFEAKIISRGDRKGGRSVVAAAAYRSGTVLKDDKYKTTHYYNNGKGHDVSFSVILAPDNAPEWAHDRQALYNAIERAEDGSKRRDAAQLAREFQPTLPRQLSKEERKELLVGFAGAELVSRGMIADVNMHEGHKGEQPHAHILATMREIGPDGFGLKQRDWNSKALLEQLRKAWEVHLNRALEKAGCEERVDHRSLKDRGIDRMPQPKVGAHATAMLRSGHVADTPEHRLVRRVAFENAARPYLRRAREGTLREPDSAYLERGRRYREHMMEQEHGAGREKPSSDGPRPEGGSWQQRTRKEREPEMEPER